MATVEVVLNQLLGTEAVQMRFYYNNLAAGTGILANSTGVNQAFRLEVVPLINAIQSDEITNVSVYSRDLGNPATARTVDITGTGGVTSTDLLTLPTDIPIYFNMGVDQSIDVNSNTPYNGLRPIRRGGKFFPGLTEDWIDVNGAEVPASLATAYAALQTEMVGAISVLPGNVQWNHVVFSYPKGGLGTLPSRNALIADVTSFNLRRATRLLSRRP